MTIAPHHHHVFDKDRKAPIDFFRLGHIGNYVLAQRIFDRHPQHSDLAFGSGDKAHNRLEQRGFPCAVYTDERGNRSSGDFKASIAQGRVTIAVGDCDVIGGDASCGVHLVNPVEIVSIVTRNRSI